MVILGIDPGTARLGYGIIKEKGKSGLSLVISGVFVTAKESQLQDRLLYLYENLLELITKYSPDVIVVERIFFNTNAKRRNTFVSSPYKNQDSRIHRS